jgi:hypothetical protein
MRWFYRWLASKINNINNDSECVPVGKLRSARADHDLPDGGLNIQIKSAIGGKIVLFRTYDRRNDENYWTTYLIVDGEDFEKSLSRIITLESMKL